MVSQEARSEVTGTVFKILVEVGQSVDDGTELMILESMKMEIPVYAPATGIVDAVHVAEGDAVEENAVVATVAPKGGDQ